jgi:hypothetical protein
LYSEGGFGSLAWHIEEEERELYMKDSRLTGKELLVPFEQGKFLSLIEGKVKYYPLPG